MVQIQLLIESRVVNRQAPLSALSRTFSLTLNVLLCVSLRSIYLCWALLIELNNTGERGHWRIPGVTSVCFISPSAGTSSFLRIGHNGGICCGFVAVGLQLMSL